MEALPQWPALLSAAFYRPGPAPPTPTHTGSAHASYTLPLWLHTDTSPPWCSWCWTSFWAWFERTWLLTSRRRCRRDILSAGLRSAPLPPKCHLLMRHICKLRPGRENVHVCGLWCEITVPLLLERMTLTCPCGVQRSAVRLPSLSLLRSTRWGQRRSERSYTSCLNKLH